MNALIKLLTIILELLQAAIGKRAAAKYDKKISDIKADPAAKFITEFGGVRQQSGKTDMPSGEARADVDDR